MCGKSVLCFRTLFSEGGIKRPEFRVFLRINAAVFSNVKYPILYIYIYIL